MEPFGWDMADNRWVSVPNLVTLSQNFESPGLGHPDNRQSLSSQTVGYGVGKGEPKIWVKLGSASRMGGDRSLTRTSADAEKPARCV